MNRRLDELIVLMLEESPSEPCIWWSGVWWSRGAIGELVEDCIESLRQSGFSSGDRLALLLPNSPLFLAVSIAVWRLGGTVVPLSPSYKSPRLLSNLMFTDVFGVVAHKDQAEKVEFLTERGVHCVLSPLVGPLPVFQGKLSLGEGERQESMAVIFLTSGTTDEPKAVPITHDNLIYDLDACLERVSEINEDDIFLNALPNFHALGFAVCGLLPLIYGLPQVIVPSFMPPENTLEAIRSAKATVVPAVPLMISLIVGAVARGMAPPPSLKLIISGGDRLPLRLAERAGRMLDVTILEGYGLTETSPVLSVNPSKEEAKMGTCGKILSCFEIEVRDDKGHVLELGCQGKLWVRGKAVASSYFRMPQLTSERFVDGWFDTQDIVEVDEDGYLTVVSRVSDIIIVGGYSVYPEEVESVLMEHPLISEAAVIGMTRGVSGEVIKAFVVLREGAVMNPRDLITFCRERLPYYKIPRVVEFLDTLPRSSVGDVIRRMLKDR